MRSKRDDGEGSAGASRRLRRSKKSNLTPLVIASAVLLGGIGTVGVVYRVSTDRTRVVEQQRRIPDPAGASPEPSEERLPTTAVGTDEPSRTDQVQVASPSPPTPTLEAPVALTPDKPSREELLQALTARLYDYHKVKMGLSPGAAFPPGAERMAEIVVEMARVHAGNLLEVYDRAMLLAAEMAPPGQSDTYLMATIAALERPMIIDCAYPKADDLTDELLRRCIEAEIRAMEERKRVQELIDQRR